ncbi:MAG: hypothetical protein JWO64_1174 [Hyphomicrobiales bacterium]|jgi:hypothetical protein|nr:hypothetical protein [Hyphomicrobiales bacterium]
MTSSAPPPNDNVIPLRSPSEPGESSCTSAAQFISQMSLEMEQLANTSGMELVAYFLALARNEAEAFMRAPAAPMKPFSSQAPYRAE